MVAETAINYLKKKCSKFPLLGRFQEKKKNLDKNLDGVAAEEFIGGPVNTFPGEKVYQSSEVLLEFQITQLQTTCLILIIIPIEDIDT